MDKDKVLEGILTTRLLSGDLATFMTELLQLNITPSEARTMDIFGDPAIGELVAKVIESKDDEEASQPALQELRDYLAKSSDVTAKSEPEAAPAEAEEEKKAPEAEAELTKNQDDAVIKPEDIKVPEVKVGANLEDVKALFSAMQEKLEEELTSIKGSIADMQATLKENTKDLKVPTTEDTDVEQKNFSAEDEAEQIEDTHDEEDNNMGLRSRKEFDVLRDMIFSLMPEDKKAEWAEKYEEAMKCPECDKNFDDEPKHEEHKDEKYEDDDLKKWMGDLHDALVELREALADEAKDEGAHDEEKHEDEPKAEDLKKDEGLTEDEIKAIEEESTNFSQKPADRVNVFNYLYGDK